MRTPMFIDRLAPSREPRLQLFVSDLGTTGVVRNAIAIANAAAAAGYQVRLLTCRPEGALRSLVSPEVTLIRLVDGQPSAAGRDRDLRRAFLPYRRHCREWRPDIMVSAGNHGHLLSTLAWAGFPGRKLLRISNDLSHGSPSFVKKLWRKAKFALVTALADSMVLNSQALRQHPALQRHLRSGKAKTISNGVDVAEIARAARQPCLHKWVADSTVPIVLAVTRYSKQKNLEVLLSAFARARRQRPMRLIFVGHGDDRETNGLRALAARLSVTQDVDFVPATPNPFPFMAAARVVALPSLWEGSSNVLLEAMACGTPVVAARTAGDAEHVLGSGKFGVLCDPRDTDGLAAALVRQTGDARVGPGPRAWAFDRQATLREYLRLFDKLTRHSAARPLTALS